MRKIKKFLLLCGTCITLLCALTACGGLFESHVHFYNATVTPSTCTEKGYTTYTCECGDTYTGNETAALGHREATLRGTPATCTQGGVSDGKYCAVCNITLVEQEPLTATGHTEIILQGHAPTCTEKGLTDGKYCTTCKQTTLPQTEISAKGHNFVNKQCINCEETEDTEGLVYTLSEDGTYYTVTDYTGTETEVVIASTYENKPVKEIGDEAFQYCGSLTEIVIPNSVASIGDYAFSECDSLTEIVIPDSVTSIGIFAFYNCDSLTQIVIPDSITSIGNYAFWYCINLTQIVVPDSITSIGKSVFRYCNSLAEITLPFVGATKDETNNTHFGYIFGATTYADNNSYVPTSLKKVTITNTTSIGNDAFYDCSSLTEIVIPNSVTSIGDWAFECCSSLTSVTFGENSQLMSIGNGAFEYCNNLTEIVIPNSVTSIGNGAFNYCESLTEIVIPNSVTSIGEFAFNYCRSLTQIVIPNRVTSIGEFAFYNCSSLTEIVIPNSVTSIGEGAFTYCESLTSVTFGENSQLMSIGYGAFSNCSSLTEIVIPDSVTNIGHHVFSNCNNLTEIVVPNSVTSIGDYAFFECSSLTEIVIPDSVASIGECAFTYCESLTEIVIPDTVTSIGWLAFGGCGNLTIYCETESKPNGWDSYWNDSNRPVYWYRENQPMESGNYWHYVSGEIVVWGYVPEETGTEGLVYTLSEDGTYYSVTNYTGTATQVVIPSMYNGKAVTSIGDGAFADCESLTKMELPDSIKSIGNGAFSECGNLTEIEIPDGVTSIGYMAFGGCTSLTEIVILDRVTSIGRYAFDRCSNLTEIVIPNSVTSIGYCVFQGCSKLTIYCESESQPSGWDSYWNPNNRPVVWGYQNDIVEIKDVASLKAFVAGDKAKGKLLASFEVNEVINVSRKLELNLNGYTITNTVSGARTFLLKAGADFTIDGTVAGSSIYTPTTANSWGVVRLAENNTRLVINGGTYPTTTDNGAFVRVAKGAKNTYAEFNNIVVKNDGGLIYSAENTTSAADNNVLNVNGGSFEHGYAVDQCEDVSTYGIRCSAFTVMAGVFTNVKINSQFSNAIETICGEVTLNNCQFSVVSSIDDGNPYSNAAICASYGSKLTLNGGSFSGLYGLALTPSGQTVINNGATITGRTSALLTYALSGSATRNTTGLEGLTNTNV